MAATVAIALSLSGNIPVPGGSPILMSKEAPLDSNDVEQATENIVSLLSSSSSSSPSAAEERDRKAFMLDLNKFMAEIGKPLSKIPIMGYKELDLFQLFKEVTSYGGFNEVVKNVGTWSKIWKRLGNFDPSITDSSFRLKKNYERYLLEYEYKCYPDHRQQAFELEKQLQMKKQQSTDGDKKEPNATNLNAGGSTTVTSGATVTMKGKGGVSGPAGGSAGSGPNKKMKGSRKTMSNTYKDVPRDKSGLVKVPLILGELTIEDLGTIIPRSPFVTDKHIWPIGFKSSRSFSSMINPEIRVKYTSQILDGGDKPQFVVTASDDEKNPIISHSPSGAWRTVLKRVMGGAKEDSNSPNVSSSSNTRKNISVSGALRFGLAHPVVASLIRELPNADKFREMELLGAPNSSSSSSSLLINNGTTSTGSALATGASSCSPLSPSESNSDQEQPLEQPDYDHTLTLQYLSQQAQQHARSSPVSPPMTRKRKGQLSSSSSSSMNDDNQIEILNKALKTAHIVDSEFHRRQQHFSARNVMFSTREELDDLESAVATLHALKYCGISTVY